MAKLAKQVDKKIQLICEVHSTSFPHYKKKELITNSI